MSYLTCKGEKNLPLALSIQAVHGGTVAASCLVSWEVSRGSVGWNAISLWLSIHQLLSTLAMVNNSNANARSTHMYISNNLLSLRVGIKKAVPSKHRRWKNEADE